MKRPEAIVVAHLLPQLLERLLEVLEDLSPTDWMTASPCPGWSVHDVALHLLGDDVGQLSIERDSHEASLIQVDRWDQLVARLNEQNELWVAQTRRISPRLLCELLRFTGRRVNDYLTSLDPSSLGPSVSWAGPNPQPMWLHMAREYTERWHHQQQIREAVGRPLLTQPTMFAPVLATFVHALPRTYEHVRAPEGTIVRLTIEGDSGGTWYLTREGNVWALRVEADRESVKPAACLSIEQDDAWRLFTKTITPGRVQPRVRIGGSRDLALNALSTVSIIA